MSPPEALLWTLLRTRQPGMPTFRRQHPIGPYFADFYCSQAKLVVEVDGSHHGEDEQLAHDEVRDRYMQKLGYRVLRCSSADILRDPQVAADGIVRVAEALMKR
jgi:very-short-patch-repair endonuclease